VIESAYGERKGVPLPRVVTISISRDSGGSGERFSVSMHEEGTPIAWRRDATLSVARRRAFASDLLVLDEWSLGQRSDPAEVWRVSSGIGRRLFDTFLGKDGSRYLAEHDPTALMIDADETALNLPWELIADANGPLVAQWPFGRIVSTRTRPAPERDPRDEDDTIAILAVVDPTAEFSRIDEELAAIRRLTEVGPVRLDVLSKADATLAALSERVAATPYDIVHFSSHGGFGVGRPGQSGLRLADGPLLTRRIQELPWAKPPYLAVMSACWSARSAPDRRLAFPKSGSNGVAAAFLSAGASACLGFGWPVSVRGGAEFVETFYTSLVNRRNVGLAVLEARMRLIDEYRHRADLAALSAVFYGDVGTAHRRDLEQGAKAPEHDDPNRRDLAMAT
jgi:hypothetical protein